jgi:hypothetical protein
LGPRLGRRRERWPNAWRRREHALGRGGAIPVIAAIAVITVITVITGAGRLGPVLPLALARERRARAGA